MSVETPIAEPPAIIQQREHIKTLEAALLKSKETERELADAKAKLTEIDRSKLEETDRLKAEKADLELKIGELSPLVSQLEVFNKAFEDQYKAELAAVPDTHRPILEKNTSNGSWPDRVAALRDLKGLIPKAGTQAGTVTNPGIPGAVAVVPTVAVPNAPKDWGNLDLRDVILSTAPAKTLQVINSPDGLQPASKAS